MGSNGVLLCDSKFEVEFDQSAVPALSRLGVEVVSGRYIDATGVLELVLRLPVDADRKLRLDVLDRLARFEHEFDHAVITDPTFVWGDSDI